MKVSVLMPSRDRFQAAVDSITSLGAGDFEVLLYVDEDDPQLNDYRNLENKHIHVHIGERLGYHNFHKMVNKLAKESKGDWLLLWNDDAIMHGDWINFEADHNKVRVMRFGDESKTMNLFPAISRKMYEVQGFYSLSTHCDSWAQDISQDLGVEVWVFGMRVEHKRDQMNDQTKSDSQKAYKTTSPEYNSDTMQEKRREVVEKLKPYV